MGGDCHTALGAHAVVSGNGDLVLRAFYQTPAGKYCEAETRADGAEAAEIAGERAAVAILRQAQ